MGYRRRDRVGKMGWMEGEERKEKRDMEERRIEARREEKRGEA